MVMKIANKYHKMYSNKYNFEIDDLIQEGTIGLLKARENFHKDRGVKFSTFAYEVCEDYIAKYCQKTAGDIKVPIKIQNEARKAVEVEANGKVATDKTKLEKSRRIVARSKNVVSLDSDENVIEPIQERQETFRKLSPESVKYLKSILDKVEYFYLEVRYDLHGKQGGKILSNDSMGEIMEKSGEWARLLGKKVLKKLKEHFGSEEKFHEFIESSMIEEKKPDFED